MSTMQELVKSVSQLNDHAKRNIELREKRRKECTKDQESKMEEKRGV